MEVWSYTKLEKPTAGNVAAPTICSGVILGVVVTVRPMEEDDEIVAREVWDYAFDAMLVANGIPILPPTASTSDTQLRVRYLRTTDPGGSWVATDGGRVVGLAQAHVRGDLWILASLGVLPECQELGIGRQLLENALDHGDRRSPGLIFSSPDPRAIHRYVRAGFAHHPALMASGPMQASNPSTSGEITFGTTEHLGLVDAIDLTVRRSTRTEDIIFLLSLGYRLLIYANRAYAIVDGERIVTLVAIDETAATQLLTGALARCPSGVQVGLNWITQDHQWVIQVAAQFGLSLREHGPVMIRRGWEASGSHLPSGPFG